MQSRASSTGLEIRNTLLCIFSELSGSLPNEQSERALRGPLRHHVSAVLNALAPSLNALAFTNPLGFVIGKSDFYLRRLWAGNGLRRSVSFAGAVRPRALPIRTSWALLDGRGFSDSYPGTLACVALRWRRFHFHRSGLRRQPPLPTSYCRVYLSKFTAADPRLGDSDKWTLASCRLLPFELRLAPTADSPEYTRTHEPDHANARAFCRPGS